MRRENIIKNTARSQMVKCGNNFSALLQSGCAKICFVVRQTALYPSQVSSKLPLR
ncbi:predicted phage protein [Salmonella enterica subsp. enterica serovar Gallinarum str. 287/91]|uniref:Predicted phage protein n=1 Tax=Salmonella gallinarum (strain 287/91 / NCTC 13346) TaxID=550538 RepID=B5R8N8_SALG2|nr:putative phage protein [Salmonella enterica subsp. enterica serovar Gallinarum str. SG9]CAR37071.1 predicted phage protein [Salmonella enterica subsp. enterica serovar Gallinarum str. 287/91]